MLMPDTLKSAAQKYWKDFLPAWVVPIIMMADTIRKDIFGAEPSAIFINAVFVLFFLSFVWWARLPFLKRIRQSHATILGMLTPFGIWVTLVLCRNLVIYTIGVLRG